MTGGDIGGCDHVIIECEQAISSYSNKHHREATKAAEESGVTVPRFEIVRNRTTAFD
jgi:hypothetical protein